MQRVIPGIDDPPRPPPCCANRSVHRSSLSKFADVMDGRLSRDLQYQVKSNGRLLAARRLRYGVDFLPKYDKMSPVNPVFEAIAEKVRVSLGIK